MDCFLNLSEGKNSNWLPQTLILSFLRYFCSATALSRNFEEAVPDRELASLDWVRYLTTECGRNNSFDIINKMTHD